jgi:hypothetical protein
VGGRGEGAVVMGDRQASIGEWEGGVKGQWWRVTDKRALVSGRKG